MESVFPCAQIRKPGAGFKKRVGSGGEETLRGQLSSRQELCGTEKSLSFMHMFSVTT